MTDRNDSLSHEPFWVDDWYVDPDSGHLYREQEEVKLEPKVMQVLVYLAHHPNKVVSRETLEATVWAGMVVGYDALSSSIIKLRKALSDDSRHPKYIETVAKKGYRLIASVKYAGKMDVVSQEGNSETGINSNKQTAEISQSNSKNITVSLTIAGIAIIAGITLWYFLTLTSVTSHQITVVSDPTGKPSAESAIKIPSIVVLPFTNLSNDSQQEYFSDGITDDIITDLSQVSSLRVIARQSAYHYKNTNISLADIAKELDVDYIVEGSVQKAGQRIRINVQLTNVDKGTHIWADRFDSRASNIFEIQDTITRRVIDAMYITLSNQENKRLVTRTTNNFDAYDMFLLGQQYSRNRTQEGYDLTIETYRHAIQLDPNYARAYGALAVTLTRGYRQQLTKLSFEEARERALKMVNKAVELDQSSPPVYWSLGYVHLFRKEYKEAEAAAKKAINLSPNYADGYGLLAFISNWRGKAEEAEKYIKKAINLNPYHTFDYPWNLGFANYTEGKYIEATHALQQALEKNPSVLYPRLFLAACYVRLGQQDDAEWEIEQVKMQQPRPTLTLLANTLPFEHPDQMNALLGDLRKGGLPE
jgi:adenylate cyclase